MVQRERFTYRKSEDYGGKVIASSVLALKATINVESI
jgi:hypothetical protein